MADLEIKRVFDIIYFQNHQYSLEKCISAKRDGKWISFSTDEVIERTNKISMGLLHAGISKGDKIALVSNNRPEWNFVDFGIQQIGAVSVPLYPNITINDYKYILEDADVKMIFVSDDEIYQKVKSAIEILGSNISIYSFDPLMDVKLWSELEKNGDADDLNNLEKIKQSIVPEDLVTIIYTSGTTGNPKGVMLSHNNIVSNTLAVSAICPFEKGISRSLSFLPVCHIFERTGIYFYFNCGSGIYYAESMDTVGENLKEVKPHFFNTVPRVLEKVYDKILAKGYEQTGIKKKLFFWALNLGLKFEPNQKMGFLYDIQLKLANKIIFSKWREALGGELQAICCAAAALQPRLARVFWSAGVRVMESYGMTETSPGVTVTRARAENVRIGTVGQPLEKVNIKIAQDGEILIKGPGVMMGYYKKPELTAEVIDQDGWLHTGDVGEFIDGDYLKITDRKKEIFKTSGGKYIAPQSIENKFKESTIIEQIMVLGENRKFPSALIIPELTFLKEKLKEKGISVEGQDNLLGSPEVIALYDEEMNKYNECFPHYEQLKKYTLLNDRWSIDSGEMTPTLKLKRKFILKKYEKEIEIMYQ